MSEQGSLQLKSPLLASMQAVTGIIADGRQIVNRAADEAVQYKKYAPTACELLHRFAGRACARLRWLRSLPLLCARSFYGDSIPGHVLADRVASFVHVFNLYWYAR